jgi:hypothetical protein
VVNDSHVIRASASQKAHSATTHGGNLAAGHACHSAGWQGSKVKANTEQMQQATAKVCG